jgi:dye decolorizing peroxidase
VSDQGDHLSDKGGERLSRRRLLAGGAIAGAGAAAAVTVDLSASGATLSQQDEELNGEATIPFHGPHQAGIEMVPQAHQNLVALQLREEVTKDDLVRLLRILTDDAARMTQGIYALADSEPEFASTPARLTVTIGFGPAVVRLVRGEVAVPTWLEPLPPFTIDRLEPEWNDGDLLLQIASDDPITLAHSTRMLLKDSRTFATVKWQQTGFRNAHGSLAPGMSMRNLLGQIDGTVNPAPGSDEFANTVWSDHDWLAGGTTMVVRRIEMLLDKWDRLDRSGREASVGRRMDNGAPLTGELEHDEPDFEATTPVGFPVIAEFAHVRRARHNGEEKIFRRGYNYDLGGSGTQVSDAGLVFTSFQADLYAQFLPIQQRLAALDLLNEWIVPIGSAVFAIPPGTSPGGFIGETLFS